MRAENPKTVAPARHNEASKTKGERGARSSKPPGIRTAFVVVRKARRRRTAIRLHLVKREPRQRMPLAEKRAYWRTGRLHRLKKPRHHPGKRRLVKMLLLGHLRRELNLSRIANAFGIQVRTLRSWLAELERRGAIVRCDNQGGRGVALMLTVNRAKLYEIISELDAGEAELRAARAARAARNAARGAAWKAQQRQWWIDRKGGRTRDRANRQNSDPSPISPFIGREKDLRRGLRQQNLWAGWRRPEPLRGAVKERISMGAQTLHDLIPGVVRMLEQKTKHEHGVHGIVPTSTEKTESDRSNSGQIPIGPGPNAAGRGNPTPGDGIPATCNPELRKALESLRQKMVTAEYERTPDRNEERIHD